MNLQSEQLRLTMVITELDVGGAEKAFVRVALGLCEIGWRVNVVSLRDAGPLAATLLAHGIQVMALNVCSPADFLGLLRLRRALRELQPDLVLTFLHQANLMGRAAAKLAGVRSVVCGVRVADRRLAVWLPERLSQSCVSRYICNSAEAARVHAACCHIPAGKMSTILNGVDVDHIRGTNPVSRMSLGVKDDDCLFVFAGRLTPQKAPLDLVQAYLQLPSQSQANAHVLLVGEGPLRESLQSAITAAGIETRIRLLGWRNDVAGLLKTADAVVLPSHWEGMPNVIMEALAANRPIIAADVDGVRELIRDGVNGRLFPAGDIHALSQLMRGTIESPQGGTQSPHTAEHVAVKELTWERCVREYDRVLRDVLASSKAGTAAKQPSGK